MSKHSTMKRAKSRKGFYEPQQEDSQYLSGFQNNFYYVKDVLKQRLYRGRLQYFVSWQGWPSKYNSWVYGETIMPVEDFLRSNQSTEPTNISSQQQKERLGETDPKNKLQCQVTIAEESQKLEKSQSNKIMVNNSESIDKSKKKLRKSQTKKNIIFLDSSQYDNYLVQTKVEVDYSSLVLEKFEQPQTQKPKQSNSIQNIESSSKNSKKTKKDIKQAKKKKLLQKRLQKSSQSIEKLPSVSSQNDFETKKQNIMEEKQKQKKQKQKDEGEQQNQQIKILKQRQRLEHNVDGLNMSSSDIPHLRATSSFMIPNIIDMNKSAIMSNCRVETQQIERKQKQKEKKEQQLKQIQKQMEKQTEKEVKEKQKKIPQTQQKKKSQKKINTPVQKNKQKIGNQNNTNKQYIIYLGSDSDDEQLSKMSFDSLDDFSMSSSISKPNKKKQYPRADIKIIKFFNRKNKNRNKTSLIKRLHSSNKDNKVKQQVQDINKIDEMNNNIGNQKEKIAFKIDIKDIKRKISDRNDSIIEKPSNFNSQQQFGKIIKNQQDGQQKNQEDKTSVENQSLLLPINQNQEQKLGKKISKSSVNLQETQNISFNKYLSRLSDTNLLQNSIQSQSALYPIEEQIISLPKKQKHINNDVINQSGSVNRLQCTFDNYSLLLLNQTQINHQTEKEKKQYENIYFKQREDEAEELIHKKLQNVQTIESVSSQNGQTIQRKSLYAKNMKKILEQESSKIRTQMAVATIDPESSIFDRNSYFKDQYYSLYSEESLSKSQK